MLNPKKKENWIKTEEEIKEEQENEKNKLTFCHSYQLSPKNQANPTIFDKGKTLP